MWIFNLSFIELLSETLVHFPLLRGIFVTWLWTTKAFPFWFYCLYSCPDEVAISQDALFCLQGASCTPRTGSTCSSSRSLTTFFPLPGGLFSVPQNNCLSSTLLRLSLFCHLWISHQQLASGVFHAVKLFSFQWLCVTQSNLLPLWYLISAYILLLSELPSFEATCTVGHIPSLSLCLLSIYFVPGMDLRY